jgi:hypothetical protein
MKDGRKVVGFAVQVIRVNSSPLSIASVGRSASHFRSTPNNGRCQSGPTGPFRANNGVAASFDHLVGEGVSNSAMVTLSGPPLKMSGKSTPSFPGSFKVDHEIEPLRMLWR